MTMLQAIRDLIQATGSLLFKPLVQKPERPDNSLVQAIILL